MKNMNKVRKARRKQTAEWFTPPQLVNEMLDKLPEGVWEDQTRTVCDPACGNGNFLVEVLQRKLNRGHDPHGALSTVYGVELMQNNVDECRERLLDVFSQHSTVDQAACMIVLSNIACADALTYKFDFPFASFEESIEMWVRWLSRKGNQSLKEESGRQRIKSTRTNHESRDWGWCEEWIRRRGNGWSDAVRSKSETPNRPLSRKAGCTKTRRKERNRK